MVHKKDSRRVVCGTCLVVAPPGEGSSAAAAPSKVTVSVRRRWGCCGWLAGPWKELAAFSFSDRARAPLFDNAFLDLERVFRYNRKADAAAAQVKICVTLRSGETRVARVGLEDFTGQLLQSGSPEWFVLRVHEGKVVLLPAHTPLTEVPTGWPFDGVPSDTRRGQKGGKDNASSDPKVTRPEDSQGKTDTTDQGFENIAPSNDSARKAEELLPAEDKDSDEETAEDITVNGEEKEAPSDKEESGREPDDDTGETDEDTGETDDDTGETDDDTGETDDDTGETDEDTEETDEETEWEADTEEETERDSDEDSDGSGGETSEDDAEETTGEGPGSERGSVLGRLGAALRHHSRGLLVAAEVALIIGTLKVWGPPAYLASWRGGGAGGEL
ncbi:mitotic apparatus protein p62-like [Eriocheir sinensis]|uniref:mitotic apparatus protein p62-like n=1 Tax=Eriocheir sinensis TaxID=95602 RepID=UPI0021C66A7A|nr:mitotic apparatus protein p62-like [Eriocheir sinensis]XP_050700516.1 mitotic apparatus protein p62-like [Eriocheir sinensis]XP_050700517.1 mitotic apparatus protein p62-like [Eriocheir sinensis]XP_050700518.1 mitotic apparatus protein p62-like [Eriocheir sinensis]XP_050700519.1 mitotic apparatus protein p62-like [Eriocheir sinensis]